MDVAYRRRFVDWPQSLEAEPFTAADLDTATVGRLLERAETRAARLVAAHRHASHDLFWLRAELALALSAPRLHPKVARRWCRAVHARANFAEWLLDHWRRLEAVVLQHEPATDAWLRRQLEGLGQDGPR
jgi:hypothetical protein